MTLAVHQIGPLHWHARSRAWLFSWTRRLAFLTHYLPPAWMKLHEMLHSLKKRHCTRSGIDVTTGYLTGMRVALRSSHAEPASRKPLLSPRCSPSKSSYNHL